MEFIELSLSSFVKQGMLTDLCGLTVSMSPIHTVRCAAIVNNMELHFQNVPFFRKKFIGRNSSLHFEKISLRVEGGIKKTWARCVWDLLQNWVVGGIRIFSRKDKSFILQLKPYYNNLNKWVHILVLQIFWRSTLNILF